MAHLQHPLIGDRQYGGRLKVPAGAAPALERMLRSFRHQALHASRLSFQHPVAEQRLDIAAPLPRDLLDLLSALAGAASPSVPFEEMLWPDPLTNSN
jgi:23S rRNA pseudouridine1911/1915/1917 synthase